MTFWEGLFWLGALTFFWFAFRDIYREVQDKKGKMR